MAGEKYETKVVVNGSMFHTDEFIFVWSFKSGNGRQNRSSGAKKGYFDGRVSKLSSRVTLTTASGASMVCHMCICSEYVKSVKLFTKKGLILMLIKQKVF